MMEYLVSFARTNDAIRGEGLLLQAGLSVRVMPLPSRIKAGCGLSFRIRPHEFQEAVRILTEAGITGMGFFEKEDQKIKEIHL